MLACYHCWQREHGSPCHGNGKTAASTCCGNKRDSKALINLDANFAQSMKINLAKFFLYYMTTGEDFMSIHVVSICPNSLLAFIDLQKCVWPTK